jgi:hypothetical protein
LLFLLADVQPTLISNMLYDDSRTISWALNGRDLGIAFTYPPEMKGSFFFPAVTMKNAGIYSFFALSVCIIWLLR